MKRLITLILVLLISQTSHACTIVMASKDGVVLAGNNEDWKDPFTSIWFIPASEDEYGRICFGFGNSMQNPQGGMNEHGVFIDANALSPTGWKAEEDKPAFFGHLIDHILAHCANVEDAITFFEKYNFPALERAKFPIADASGTSIVVEWGQGKLQIVRNSDWYQISTNFVQTNFNPEDYPCNRYKLADQIFKNANKLTIDVIREILSATHAEGDYPTNYSNICDLKNGIVYLYNFHNFEHVVIINLKDELKKGKRIQEISSLFPYTTHWHKIFLNRSVKASLLSTIKSDGIEKGTAKYHEMKAESRKTRDYNISEADINELGYQLLGESLVKEAIEIFKLNVAEYPKSWNVYDSLGEAFMKNGDKELAIQNYEKSLELNPGNENGKMMLKKLKKNPNSK
jgi:tetratricopeptide (TPR) repeat protein